MKGAVISILIFLLLSTPLFTADNIVDNADRIKNWSLDNDRRDMKDISSRNDFDLVILFEKNISGADPVSYAKAFFDSNNYGLGKDKSGCLLLITDNNDTWLYASGRGVKLMEDSERDSTSFRVSYMKNRIEYSLNSNNLRGAIQVFYDSWRSILDRAPPYLAPGVHVTDKFIFLEKEELANLSELSDKVSATHKFDIVIVTDRGGRKGELKEIAAEIFLGNGFGYGKNRDGAILYIVQPYGRSMEYDYETFGRGKSILNNAAKFKLESDIAGHLGSDYSRDYYGACQSFIENWNIFLYIDENGREYCPENASLSIAKGRLTDNADLLTDTDKENLEKMLDEISSAYKFDLVIAGEKSIGGRSRREYADDFFDYNGFGIGEDKDGCLFLQVTGNRSFWFSTSGRGIGLLNDLAYEELADKVAPLLKDRRSFSAYLAYINTWEKFLALEAQGRQYNFFMHYHAQLILAAVCLVILIITFMLRQLINQLIGRLRKR